MLIVLNVCLILVSYILNIFSSCFMEGACVVPRAPAVMTKSGSTFHPSCLSLSNNGWYLVILLFMVSCGNLSLVYVNSINWTVRSFVGFNGGELRYGSPLMHNRSGLNLALQWHLCCPHVQGRSHGGTVFSCGELLNFPAFISI